MEYLALTGSQLDSISTSSDVNLNSALLSPGGIISTGVTYFFPIAAFALAVFIVLSGFSVMSSKGDPRAMEAAKAKLTYAILGFFIIFGSYWIVQIVGLIFNIQAINDIFS